MADGPHHLLLITPGFPAAEADTACIPALQLYVRALAQQQPGWRISLLPLHYPYRTTPYRWHGLEVLPCGGANRRQPWRWLAWLRAVQRLRALQRRQPITLIHSFWLGECSRLGEWWAGRLAIPHLLTLMGQEVCRRQPWLGRIDRRRSRVVALSAFQDEWFARSYGRHADQLIPWGVPEAEGRHSVTEPEIDLLGVGALSAVKEYALFLEVVAELLPAHPQLRCLLVGEGPQRPLLERRAEQLGISAAVTFAGGVPREQVIALMRRARVLLHPARFESFGLAMAEAQALGLGVVSRAVGIAAVGPGWELAEEPRAMAAAVGRLLARPAAEVAPRFPLAATVAAYRQLYGASGRSGWGGV